MIYSKVHYNNVPLIIIVIIGKCFKMTYIQGIHRTLREIINCMFKLWGLESYWLLNQFFL